jgi:hypothetical protein
LTSAKYQPVLPQTPELQVAGWTCGPALPQIIRQLPRFDPVRVAETKRHTVPSSAPSRSATTGNWKVRLASGKTPQTGVSDIPGGIGAPGVACRVAERKADRLITPPHDLAADRSQSFVPCDATNEPSVHDAYRVPATFERIVRGNAPNIGGSYEKRNVDQRTPAGRKPYWRC